MTFGKAITLLGSDQPPRTVQNETVKDSGREEGEWQQERWDTEQNGEHTETWKGDKEQQGSPALYTEVSWQELSMCLLFYAAMFSHHHHNQFLLQFKATGISPVPTGLHHHDHSVFVFAAASLASRLRQATTIPPGLAWPGKTQHVNSVQPKRRAE